MKGHGCMGADKDEAYKQADIEFEKIWKRLYGKYKFYFQNEREAERLIADLKNSLREIFWVSAADSF